MNILINKYCNHYHHNQHRHHRHQNHQHHQQQQQQQHEHNNYETNCAFDDENGEPIWREDYQEHQIQGILKSPGDWYSEEKFFLTEKIPTRWVVWAHSKSQGWVERIEEQVNYKK